MCDRFIICETQLKCSAFTKWVLENFPFIAVQAYTDTYGLLNNFASC